MILLQQMFIFFMIMLVGVLCRKKGLFDDKSGKLLSSVVVNVANPALAISAVANSESSIEKSDLATVFIVAVAYYLFMLTGAYVLPKLLRAKGKDVGAFAVMTVFSNIGFMGYPLLQAMYGPQAVLYALPFNIIYNILIYTWGIKTMTKEEGSKGQKLSFKETLGKLCNIGVLASLIAIIIFVTGITLPSPLVSIFSYLGNLTGPLSMIVIGDSISQMNLKSLLKNKRLVLFSALKLLILPIIGLTIIALIPAGVSPLLHDEMFFTVCLVMLATPVGSMTAMFAQQYDSNVELVSQGVALSTILSVATMPIVSILMALI